ncbi:MAG: SPASM domain-containing protein [Anaerolineae bacterium]
MQESVFLALAPTLFLKCIKSPVVPKRVNEGGFMFEINEYLAVNDSVPTRTPPCPMLFNRVHITYEGYLNACCVDYQNYLAVADLNTLSLRDAWHSESFVELRRKHLAGAVEGTLCYNCLFNKDTPVEPWMPQHAAAYRADRSRIATEMRERLSGSPASEGQEEARVPSGDADVRGNQRSK